jgi:16S rRNA (cytosine967-C5)-methyltransferase
MSSAINAGAAAQAVSPAEIRARAARIVSQVADQGRSLDALLPAAGGSAQERGLTRTLVYGTVRWHIRLIAVLAKLSSRPPADLDPELRALLLVGLFQLLHSDIAAHAAVAETVEATRALKQPKAAGFVNAILRRCQRETAVITEAIESGELDRDGAVCTAHPHWFVQMLASDRPQTYRQILDANNAHPPMWLRVNRQHATAHEYVQRLSEAGQIAHLGSCSPEAVRLEVPTDVRNLPGFSQGHVSVQDAAAQLAAHLLAPQPGERVLDACAAPGGKTCHLLELEPQIRELVALDISSQRLRKVEENLLRLNLQATLITGDASEPDTWWDGRAFNRILLDVPCSATGVMRRHPDIKLLRRAADIDDLAQRQAALLSAMWPLLAPGGRLLYASCSALRQENAAVVAAFLKAHADAQDCTAAELAARLPGADQLAPYAGPGYAIPAGEAQMDGFYYACLDKRH